MAGYKSPDFNERNAAARAAKEAALEKLRNKPAADPQVIAERQAARAAKEAAAAERRATRQREADEAKAAKLAARQEAEAARLAAEEAAKPRKVVVRTADEMKAARDARYAARKARQG